MLLISAYDEFFKSPSVVFKIQILYVFTNTNTYVVYSDVFLNVFLRTYWYVYKQSGG